MYRIGPSKIHGRGVIAAEDISKDTKIGDIFERMPDIRTKLGKYINHDFEPNSEVRIDMGIYALADIKKGEEMTLDYNDAEKIIGIPIEKGFMYTKNKDFNYFVDKRLQNGLS